LAADQPPSVVGLIEAGEQALYGTGNLTWARQYFGEAARWADAVGDAESLGRAALGLSGLWVHEHRGAAEAARIGLWRQRALASLDRSSSLAARLRMRVTAEADYRAGSAAAILEAVVDARNGDALLLAEALNLAHHCLLGPEHATTRLSLAEELLAIGTTVGRPIDALMGLLWRTVDLFLAGDPHAGRSMTELREFSQRSDHSAVGYVVSAMEVMLAIRHGQLAQAEDLAAACRQRGFEVGDADAVGWYGAQMAVIRWYEDRSGELVRFLSQTAYSPTLAEPDDAYFAALAVSAANAGDRNEALGALRRLRRKGLGALRSSSTWLVSMLGAAEAAFLLDDLPTARETYDLLLPYADMPVMASLAIACFGSAHYPLGLATLTMGNLDRAAEHLEAAVEADEALGNWPAQRLASRRLAAVLRRRDMLASTKTPIGLIVCRRAVRGWELTMGAHSATVDDSVGMRHLAVLLTRPDLEVAAVDLAGSALPATDQPMLDPAAKQAYRRRIERLRVEIADAVDNVARAARLRNEYQQILAELQRATGLGGRPRAFADSGERARTAVQKAIRRAIARVATVDSAIGRELNDTVVTGLRCCYRPRRAEH
jgi:tetratricopeptide (TPR) repeat protein